MLSGRRPTGAHDRGTTLIELLTVVVIIGILAAIAITVFVHQTPKGYDAQAKSDLHQAGIAEEDYLAGSGVFSTNVGTTTRFAVQYQASDHVGPIKAWLTDGDGHRITGKTGTLGICLAAQSDSGSWFAFASALGGLQSGTFKSAAKACPK